jgi:hypothetical protein
MNKSNGITIDEYATCLDGKVVISKTPSDAIIGGLWAFNDKLLTCLPSTNYTPIPVLKYKEPQNVTLIQYMIKTLSSLS